MSPLAWSSVRLYDLKHSFSTLWVETGEDLALLQKILGDSSMKTTSDIDVRLERARDGEVRPQLEAKNAD